MKTSSIWLFISLIICVTALSARNDTTIRFGISLSTYTNVEPFVSQRTAFGNQALAAIGFAIDHFNANGGIVVQGVTYDLDLVLREDEDNSTMMMANYAEMIQSGEVDFFLGPMASDFSIMGSFVTSPDYLMMGINAGSPGFYLREKCAATATAAPLQFDSALPELRLAGAKKVVVVSSNHAVMKDACGSVSDRLSEHGLDMLGYHTVDISLTGLTDDIIQNISDTVVQITQDYEEIDALMVCVFPPGGLQLMTVLKEENYNPKSILFAIFPGAWDSFDSSIINYVTGFATWHPNASFYGDNFGSTTEFRDNFLAAKEIEPDDLVVFSVAAVSILKEAIESADSFDQDDVFQNILSIDLDTFMGKYRFSGDSAQQHSFIFVQWVEGERKIVSPIQVKQTSLVYPFPRWDEREMNPQLNIVEIIFIIVTSVSILICVGYLIFVNVNIKEEAVRASTPMFLNIVGVGGILCLVSIFFWLPYFESITAFCHLRFWTLGIGFAVTFGCLFAKTWRIARVFEKSFSIVTVTENHVLSVMGALVLIEVIILVFFSVLGGTYSAIEIVDEDRLVLNYHICQDTDLSILMLGILGVYTIAIIIFGTIISVKIHNRVSDEKFNESKIIGFMIYNMFFFFVVIAAIHFATIERYFLFALRSAGIIVTVLITVISIWIHKERLIRKRVLREHSGTGMNSSLGNGSKQSNTNVAFVASQQETRYDKLKARYKKIFNDLQMYKEAYGELPQATTSDDSS